MEEKSQSKEDLVKYPRSDAFLAKVVSDIPELLTYFLKQLLPAADRRLGDADSKPTSNVFLTRDSIAHAVVSSLCPSFLSPLHLSRSMHVHQKSKGSRLLVDLLHSHGVCASYYHQQQYEAFIAMSKDVIQVGEGVLVQRVYDNTDHNTRTMTGKDTYHFLGAIAVYTPAQFVINNSDVERQKNARLH